ncbi:PLC-like phosphodiesterase [Lactifluus volemus]|nr:PLC-like phosphodiesterase [Lactifluus volemus]
MSKAFPFRYNLSIPKDCPWRIYRDKPSKKRIDILVLPKRKLDAFLSTLPDSTRLNSICLPGKMAFYGWPISQCQSETTPLSVQLADGIRVLDIRLAIQNGRLVTFHGQFPERTAFQSILGDLHAFLTSPTPTEFSALVHGELEAGPGGFGMWFLENRIPTLGEVRGKAILFSRFGDGTGWNGGLEGMGIHPTTWPDSAKQGFTWTCKDVTVRTQDWYNISSFLSIPEKTQVSEQLLLPPPVGTEQSVLSITYFSAASIPLATPSTVATGFGWPRFGMGTEGVNSRISKFLLAALKEDRVLRAWTLMDFYNKPIGSDVVPLLVELTNLLQKAAHLAARSSDRNLPST